MESIVTHLGYGVGKTIADKLLNLYPIEYTREDKQSNSVDKRRHINTTHRINNIVRQDNPVIHDKKKREVDFMAEIMELAKLTGGQALGAVVYDTVETRPEVSAYRDYINAIGGLALAVGPAYMNAGDTVEFIGAVAGTHMLARKLVDVGKRYMPVGGARVSPRARASYAPIRASSPSAVSGGVQIF